MPECHRTSQRNEISAATLVLFKNWKGDEKHPGLSECHPTVSLYFINYTMFKFFVVLHIEQQYKFTFVEASRKFIIAKLSREHTDHCICIKDV